MTHRRRLRTISFLAMSGLSIVGLASPGCGPANPAGRVAVSGQVTLDGAPVDEGVIEFAPLDQPLGSGAMITNGTYSIDTHRGLPPGRYTVQISALKQVGEAKQTDPTSPPGAEGNVFWEERVAPRFNATSGLTAEVPAGAKAQVFDFVVSGAGAAKAPNSSPR